MSISLWEFNIALQLIHNKFNETRYCSQNANWPERSAFGKAKIAEDMGRYYAAGA